MISRHGQQRWASHLLVGACLVILSGAAWAEAAGKITHLAGTLYSQKKGAVVKRLTLDAPVEVGDQLTTDKDSYAQVTFADGAQILLRPNTRITIDDYVYVKDNAERDSFAYRLLKGGMRAVSGFIGKRSKPDAYRAGTLIATIGVRGTVWDALLCQGDCTGGADGLYTFAVEDTHTLANDSGTTAVTEGEGYYVKNAKSKPVRLPAIDGLGLQFADAPSDAPSCAGCGGAGSSCIVH